MHTQTVSITPKSPFSFDRTLDFLGAFSPMAGEQLISPRRLEKALEVDGTPVVVDVAATGDDLSLAIDSEAPLTASTRAAVVERVRFMLSLDDDLDGFYARAGDDAPFAPLARALFGLHQPKFPSPFEIAAWAVLVQRVRIPVALRVKRKLTNSLGARVGARAAFPSPARVLAASRDDIAGIVTNPVKAAALVAVAEAFEGVDERWLREAPYGEVEAWLLALPRIGAWSASFILYRGLGRMERVDLAKHPELVACAERVYGEDANVDAIAASYGPDVGTWALYLRARA